MKFEEIFPIKEDFCGKSMVIPWSTHWLYKNYDDRLKAMGSVWSLAFANFIASYMELEPQ